MGHHINALIGTAQLIEELRSSCGLPQPTPLPHDLAIVPLGHTELDRLASDRPGPAADGFTYLRPSIEERIGTESRRGSVLYIETYYFGGVGSQSAALFEKGSLSWRDAIPVGPIIRHEHTPINRGLAALGVQRASGQDEFDTVGLRQFRTLEHLGLDENGDD